MSKAALPAAIQDEMPRVLACSTFIAESLAREPDWLASAAGELLRARAPGEIEAAALQLVEANAEEAQFMAELRRLRRHELVRIAWRDLSGRAALKEVLAELSALADGCIIAAHDFACASLAKRYGQPRSPSGELQSLMVLAMGKLGGGELNFSSDVDLVFLFPEAGETDGARAISNDEFFTRLGQSIIRILDAPTAEGMVFRVDMRLRPFGESGPLAVSASAFEDYLQKHGRDWERYAYVKARPVCGRQDYDALFANVIRPFVYRRYLDYGVFESLRSMKQMIAREVERRELQNDIKLGPGGIREIEFIVQSHQLTRGGADGRLQSTSLLDTLPSLAGAKLLPEVVVKELGACYEFLRRTENRLQMVDDAQTHELPEDAAGQARLALSMGFAGWEEFAAQLSQVRASVTRHFHEVVAGPTGAAQKPANDLALLWTESPTVESLAGEVQGLGLQEVEAISALLIELRASSYFKRLDDTGRRRLAQLIPRALQLLAALPAERANAATLGRVLRIFEAIGGRTAYLALLNENHAALDRLLRLCSLGEYLPRQVAMHPVLLDELLDSRVFESLPDREQFARELQARTTPARGDEEQLVDALRKFRRAALFRVATLDLSGQLPLMQVSDRLTDVAELIVQVALDLAREHLARIHGEPRCEDNGQARPVQVAVVGYGKLGGMELGYASDLDLVFLHDSRGNAQQTAGPKVIDNALYFVRLLQRLVHLLTVATAAGRLYEVDMRLRPGGKGGLAFTAIDAFDDYQRQEAWTWEHQALLHSRAIAGDASLCADYEALRLRLLSSAVRRETLREDVAAMRERMRTELARSTADQFDLKQDRGGIADIEFLAQYWVLQWGAQYPPLMHFADTIRQLESLGSANLVPQQWIDLLVEAYRRFRQATHRLALDGQGAVVEASAFAGLRTQVARLWETVMVAGQEPPPL